MNNKFYMKKALVLAEKANQKNEVPIGCIIVNNSTGKIIAKSYNKVQNGKNATYHAEIKAIEKACKKMKSKYLFDCSMYVTLEPCTMCAGAISLAKISNLYFAAPDKKGGAIINGVKFFDKKTCHHIPEVKYGILEKESTKLLKDFFDNLRKQK
jgi:tRNA(Arg) A34 adenosine deaminase TadA